MGQKERRRWFQFRLRTLLIAILVLSLPLSWFAVRLARERRQREAVEAIERLGGWAGESTEPSAPKWVRAFVPEGVFSDVVEVELVHTRDRNARLEALKAVSTDREMEELNRLQIPEDIGVSISKG